MERRDFCRQALASGTALAGITSMAGCSTPEQQSDTDASGVSPPDVTSPRLDQGGWERQERFARKLLERDLTVTTIEGYGHTEIYEDAVLRRKLKEGTMGNFDQPIMLFFATRVALDPALGQLPLGVGRAEIVAQARTQAERQFNGRMADNGLTNVRRTGTQSLDVDTGQEAELTSYAADFEYDSISVPLPNGDQLSLDGGTLTISGYLAVWHNDENVMVAGGAFPADTFDKTVEKDLTEMISVTVDVDLGLTPDAYSEELLDLIRSVR